MRSESSKPHLLYIDCLRGYAVLMVITCHLTYQFPNLPYPVHRLTVLGWFGVQLFFLASCITLMMSWNFEKERKGSADVSAFFIRRFFRIAPAYYAAGVFYFFFFPPAGGFDAWQAFASAAFINTWNPSWTPTVPTAWTVVPGGWSIGVEFSFYFLFPLFVIWVTSLSRALLVVLASVVIGVLANKVELAILGQSYTPVAIDNFLFFWFPNQMSVFALGGVLYFLLRAAQAETGVGRVLLMLRKRPNLLAAIAIATFLAQAYVPLGHHLGATPLLPASLTATLSLMVLIVALSGGRGLLVNRYAAAMGRVSFSAYLLHFAVLHLFEVFPGVLHSQATGFGAIFAFVIGWAIAVPITYGVSLLSYQMIEQPMINVGRALIGARRRVRPATIPVGPPGP